MKKFLAILMVAVMMLSIVACDLPTEAPSTPSNPSTPSTPSNPPVSGVMTHAQFLAAETDAPVEIEAYVQATQSWWDNKITIYAMDQNYGGYIVYEAACSEEDAAKLVPGTKINVKGYKTFFGGMPEIASGAELTIIEDAEPFIGYATVMNDKLGTQELINETGAYAAFQGLTVAAIKYKNDTPGDDIYVAFTLGDATYNFCVERYLTDPETDLYKGFVDGDVKVGDVVNVYGFVYWYDADVAPGVASTNPAGINTHITKITHA